MSHSWRQQHGDSKHRRLRPACHLGSYVKAQKQNNSNKRKTKTRKEKIKADKLGFDSDWFCFRIIMASFSFMYL